ncbi:MAG TPA: alpha/beta hydrolase [Opitutaceae bacterium]|nr:alpha/beta hydrolase [Opitutaceae bacterium]
MVWLQFVLVAFGAVGFAYLVLMAYAWVASDRMIFHPPPPSYPDGPQILKIPAADGVRLAARHLPWPAARYTLLYFHGNAEDLGEVEPTLAELRDRLGVAVVGWDYRGYGRSGGVVGEPATLRDAHTVLAYVTDTLGVPAERVILYGRSLGGAPAADLAATHRCAGLIFHGAFTSAFRVMTQVRLLPFDKFIVLENLPRVTCPVLVLHGTADEVIPFRHAQRLFAAAPGPKFKLWVEGAGHNDLIETAGDAYWQALRDFVGRL